MPAEYIIDILLFPSFAYLHALLSARSDSSPTTVGLHFVYQFIPVNGALVQPYEVQPHRDRPCPVCSTQDSRCPKQASSARTGAVSPAAVRFRISPTSRTTRFSRPSSAGSPFAAFGRMEAPRSVSKYQPCIRVLLTHVFYRFLVARVCYGIILDHMKSYQQPLLVRQPERPFRKVFFDVSVPRHLSVCETDGTA